MKKFKSMMKRAKALIAAAAVAVTTVVCSVVASAETAEAATGSEMSTVLASAGDQITSGFSDMIVSVVPVIIGVMLSGLTIFGIIMLVKLAKKIFGKVAG